MTAWDHLLPFTAHNIELSDGRRTVPDNPVLLSQEGAMTSTLRTLQVVAGRGERLRIVDLGCLEGGYSIEFARLGHDVLGIDARQAHIDRAQAVQEDLGLTNVEFVVDDVKNLADYGRFDVIFCCGLLYHLENPRSYINVLGQVCDRALILNTHYAREIDPLYDDPAGGTAPDDRVNHGLSALGEHEGLPGRWYDEYDPAESRAEIEERLWASHSNDRSFWPTKQALLSVCREAGFDVIYEQHDVVDDIMDNALARVHDRGMFSCMKLSSLSTSQTMLDDAKRHASRLSRRIQRTLGR